MSGNRLFVKKDDSFDLTVLYTKTGNLKVSIVEDVPEAERDNWEEFTISFMMPDFGVAKGIMRNSMDYDISNNQVINLGAFNNALIVSLAKGWNLKDDEGQDIPCDVEKLNELRPDIVRMFVELLHEKLREEGVYQAIMLS